MSAMVDVWVGELTKLREKVLARKPFLSKAKAKEGSEEQAVAKEPQKMESMGAQRDTATMIRGNCVFAYGSICALVMCLLGATC